MLLSDFLVKFAIVINERSVAGKSLEENIGVY